MLVIFCLHGRTFFSYHNSSRCEFDSEGKHWIVMRGGGVGITMTHDIQGDDREKEERGERRCIMGREQESGGTGSWLSISIFFTKNIFKRRFEYKIVGRFGILTSQLFNFTLYILIFSEVMSHHRPGHSHSLISTCAL